MVVVDFSWFQDIFKFEVNRTVTNVRNVSVNFFLYHKIAFCDINLIANE